MTDSILQTFLDNRIIKTDDPNHMENLKKASVAVQRLLEQKKNKPRIICYTLVALDPTISSDDPIVKEVEDLIIKYWTTFRNSVAKTKDVPISYIQAVILDALSELSQKDDLAAIIWHTGCNIISHYKLAGQEEVLTHFLLGIGEKVEESGRKRWNTFESAKIDTITSIDITLPEVSQGKVDKNDLENHLKAAAVHQAWAPQAGGGENPFTPAQNNVNWPKYFAERAATGLAEEMNAALSAQNKSLKSLTKSIQEAINAYFVNLKPQLEQVASSILLSTQSINKQIELLWWKQSLYSSRLDSSYRKLDSLTLAMAMAVDLADNVLPIYPRSVDYFLRETLRDILRDEADTKVPIAEILEQLRQLSEKEKRLLKDLFNESEGRKPLGVCLAEMVRGKMNFDQLFSCTGLEHKAKISLGEFTIWLFHDLQANKLANTK